MDKNPEQEYWRKKLAWLRFVMNVKYLGRSVVWVFTGWRLLLCLLAYVLGAWVAYYLFN